MGRMTGGEAVVQGLLSHGVDTLFGLPGAQNDWLYNALYDAGDQIRVIHPRHEQTAAYMALGYALARDDVGVFSVVPGPGVLNTTAALATAYARNARVLCLVGQIQSDLIGRGTGALHEIPDQQAILRGLTKWADRVNHAAEAPAKIAEAFYQLYSGRPRPVALEVPPDVLAARAEVKHDLPPRTPYAPPLDLERIEEAAQLLGQSQRPMIFGGSGAQGVSEAIIELAEMLQAPVVSFRTGKGVLSDHHDLSLTLPPAHECWKTTDVVLAVGTYMRVPLQRWGTDSHLKIIRVDVDPEAMNVIQAPDVPIVARAEEALPCLIQRTARHNRQRQSRSQEMLALKADWEQRARDGMEPQHTYVHLLREELGEDGIFVDEMTQVGYASWLDMPVYQPHTFITPGYQGTLGYGFPTALGVKVARPDTPVIAVTGDGGLLYAVGELSTAVQHGIGLVTIVFNNNQYGNVQMMQKRYYDSRVIATDLHNPDFVRLAESFGAQGIRADTDDQLRQAIRAGFASADVPTLIEVPVGDMPFVFSFYYGLPRVRPPQPTNPASS